MSTYRVGEAASLLGVSTDTIRRWIDSGRLQAVRTDGGHRLVDGASLAALARESAPPPPTRPVVAQSARNRMAGVVTRVVKDRAVATVEMQAGPFRLTSIMTRDAVDDLGLRPGVEVMASVKSTNVVVELPS